MVSSVPTYLKIQLFILQESLLKHFSFFGGEMEAEQDKVIYLKLLLKRIKLELRVTVIQCNKVINLYSQLDVYSIPLRA